MATGRTVRGLAGLIDSDNSVCSEDEREPSTDHKEPKSVFDVPAMFNPEVQKKLREGDHIQLKPADKDEKSTEIIEIIDLSNSPSSQSTEINSKKGNRKRRRNPPSSNAKHAFISLLDNSDEEDTSIKATKVTKATRRETRTTRRNANKSSAANSAQIVITDCPPNALSSLDISLRLSDSEDESQNVYRIVISQIGNDDVLSVIRLTDDDKMEVAFKKAEAAAAMGGILMMGRREVLPEDTPASLGLSSVGLTRMEYVPVRSCLNEGRGDGNHDGFIVKFITRNRRETREIKCENDDKFALIFNRYCASANVERGNVVFKFEDEVVDDAETPADLGMESGDLIEVHVPQLLPREPVEVETSEPVQQSKRPRRSCRAF